MGTITLSTRPSTGIVSKQSSDASKPLEQPAKATSSLAGDVAPTAGKAIPVFTGSVKLDGEVIWAHLFRNSHNECRAHVAVCFGQNVFSRTVDLSQLILDGSTIYARTGGATVDPPDAVRFYDGTQTAADPLIVSIEGADRTPAWKGYTYAVLENILLADEYSAVISDNATDDVSIQVEESCDASLDGIDLVADPATGLFYGIEFPMTGSENLIVSDGCQVISRAPIPNFYPEAGTSQFVENVYPILCDGRVAINTWGFLYSDPLTTQGNGTAFVNPRDPSRELVPGVFVNYLGPQSVLETIYPPPPDSTGCQYILSYPIPGFAETFFLLRFFERGGTIAEHFPGYVVPGSGNICGVMVNFAGEFNNYADRQLADRTEFWGNPAEGWWTDECPEVDTIIHLKGLTSSVDLGAYKQSGSDILVYRINHNVGGMEISSSSTILLETANGIEYDRAGDKILVSVESGKIYEVSPSGFVSYVIPVGSRLAGPTASLSLTNQVALLNDDGSSAWVYTPGGGGYVPLYSGLPADDTPFVDLSRSRINLPTATGTVIYSIGQIAQEDISIVDLVTDICVLRGYDETDLSFQGMATLACRGMRLNASVSCTDLINRIGTLYGFIFAESDGKLKFIRRRAADGSYTPDLSLTDADLVEDTAKITAQRNSATKVLTSLELSWIDPDRDFENNSLAVYRTTGIFTGQASVRDDRLSLPLVIEPNMARQLLFESFFAQVEAETFFSITLPPEHIRIEPGTLLALDAGGAERLAVVRRVTQRTDNNTIDVEAEAFMAQASTDISGDTDGNPPAPPSAGVAGVYVHLDIPLIRTTDFEGGAYAIQYHGLTTAGVETWDGADLYRSRDGTTFTKIFDYDFAPMTVARATNALDQPDLLFAMDTASELIIEVTSGDADLFRTVTYLEQMNGATLAAYGREGAWEIISWGDVTDNLDGTLSLTNLQRGLYGTHMVFDALGDAEVHTVNDRVCILESLKTLASVYGVVDIGVNERFGMVTAGHSIADNGPTWHVMDGISVRPFAVANVIAEHTGGEATLEISWDACSTIPGAWRDDGSALAMPEDYTYGVLIETVSAGDFEFTTSDTSYSWADYGSELGVDTLAEDEITVTVWPISPVWGASYNTIATGREA